MALSEHKPDDKELEKPEEKGDTEECKEAAEPLKQAERTPIESVKVPLGGSWVP